jgi:hypothetical protein
MDIKFCSQVRKFAIENDKQVLYEYAKNIAIQALKTNTYKEYIRAAGIFEGICYAFNWQEKVTKTQIKKSFVSRESSALAIMNLLEKFVKTETFVRHICLDLYFQSKYCQADDYWYEKKQIGLMEFWEYCTNYKN